MTTNKQKKYFISWIILFITILTLTQFFSCNTPSLHKDALEILYKAKIDNYVHHIERQDNHIKTLINSKFSIPVKLTAYNAEESQTDSSPTITASNRKVREGWCALSRDIENTLSLKFGDIIIVSIDGEFYGDYEFQDRMHKRKTKQVDLFMNSKQKSLEFGIKKGSMQIKRHHLQSL